MKPTLWGGDLRVRNDMVNTMIFWNLGWFRPDWREGHGVWKTVSSRGLGKLQKGEHLRGNMKENRMEFAALVN